MLYKSGDSPLIESHKRPAHSRKTGKPLEAQCIHHKLEKACQSALKPRATCLELEKHAEFSAYIATHWEDGVSRE